jgi:hypothetical protein
MNYVIFENDEGTELGVAAESVWWMLQRDADGHPMHIVREFQAETWDEVKAAHEQWLRESR